MFMRSHVCARVLIHSITSSAHKPLLLPQLYSSYFLVSIRQIVSPQMRNSLVLNQRLISQRLAIHILFHQFISYSTIIAALLPKFHYHLSSQKGPLFCFEVRISVLQIASQSQVEIWSSSEAHFVNFPLSSRNQCCTAYLQHIEILDSFNCYGCLQ